MSHSELASIWRNASSDSIYFDRTLPYYNVFEESLFKHFGGFTPALSKAIGWNDK